MPCVWVPQRTEGDIRSPGSLYFIRSQGSLWMIVVREQRQNQSGVDSPPYIHTYSHKHTHTESYCQDKGEHMPGLAHVAFLGEHL